MWGLAPRKNKFDIDNTFAIFGTTHLCKGEANKSRICGVSFFASPVLVPVSRNQVACSKFGELNDFSINEERNRDPFIGSDISSYYTGKECLK
jgi:hypothetical protein